MAYSEIYRTRTEEYTLQGEVKLGNATGTATVTYYFETVVERDFIKGGSVFAGKTYLNVTSVSSPVTVWLGINSSYSTLKLNKMGGSSSSHGSITSAIVYQLPTPLPSEGGAIELQSEETYSDILVSHIDQTKNLNFFTPETHRFMDGKFPLEIKLKGTIYLIDRFTSNNSYHSIAENSLNTEEINEDATPIQDKSTQITTADNFTDEDYNPVANYSIFYLYKSRAISSGTTTYKALRRLDADGYYLYPDYSDYQSEEITVQIGLSLDGETLDVPYRDAPIDGQYVFSLTEEEMETLRRKVQGSSTVSIYYMIKTTRTLHRAKDGTDLSNYPAVTQVFYSKSLRNFTVVNCNPSLNPTVKDIKPETLALTGDENTFVRYESTAEYAINATVSKHATIVSQYVQCGTNKIEGLPYGVINNTESSDFIFYVLDSRGLSASGTVFKNLVEYVKLTCYQNLEIGISGETGAAVKLTISGNYYNGSFGVADNTLKLEVRYTNDNGDMSEWITLTGTPTFNGNTYELETTVDGFTYSKAYTFQCRATDKLNVVESSQYKIKFMPVFDWSKDDFNFNVPVNIEAENLNMHGETIIRHNKTANNTVVSGSGGNVYIRPSGADNTSGEMKVYSNGNVDINGNLNVNGVVNFNSFSINGNTLADYVIATGEESMGSNGTWYWRKWASGKSEAWGCRNFGDMATTTAWGSLYRSAIFTQDLPSNVFKSTPDLININFVHTNAGGWIAKYDDTAPSAITTGSFAVIRPVSGNITPTNIGFYIIGKWQ